MKQKQILILLGAAGFVFLLFFFAVLIFAIKTVFGLNKDAVVPAAVVTLCDQDSSGLCVVSFGANSLNRMVINFQLPNADYAPFYVKAENRGTVNVYSCEVAQSNAYCTGIRSPLGETIEVEVYTTSEDTLIAHGTFLVSAIALSTPISLPLETPTQEASPTPTEAVPTSTSTPNVAYPNP